MELITHGDHRFYKWTIGPSTFLTWPEKGARLMNWFVTLADGTTRDVIHWPTNPDYTAPRAIRGGNPILFPFVARSYDQGDEGFWRPNKNTRLAMPRHGFAVDGHFEITDIHPRGFSAKLKPTEKDIACYPYRYTFTVRYLLNDLSLAVDLILKNEDEQPIPWAAGHHFYFQLPWHEGLGRKNYQINIPSKKAFTRHIDGSLIPSEDYAMPTTFDDVSLLDRMHTKLKEPKVTFSSKGAEDTVTIRMSGTPALSPWTTVTTWTQDAASPFYCIEPWMAPANTAEHKKGLCLVEPQQTQIFTTLIDLF